MPQGNQEEGEDGPDVPVPERPPAEGRHAAEGPDQHDDESPARPASAPRPDPELTRLRAEVAELRDRLGTQRRRRARLLAVRRALAAVLIALAAVSAVGAVIGVWGARTALNTDRWVAAVGDLPEQPDVNRAVSTYLTGQVFDHLDVQKRLSDALPERASFLAAPATDQVHDYVRGTVSKLMRTEEFEDLWRSANRRAHARIVAVLENRSENVRVRGDTVTLNLLPLVNNALVAVEDRLPTLFGKRLDLPTLTSGEVPPKLHDRVQKALGVSLPADFAQVRLYDRHELGQLQDLVVLCKRAVVGLVVAVFVLLALALWTAPDRRRTLLQFGLWLVVAVTVLSSLLRGVREQLLAQVPAGTYRDGVQAGLWTVFASLRTRGDQLLWFGVGLAALLYLVGPGRLPVLLRRTTVRAARATGRFAGRTGARLRGAAGPGPVPWIRRHADVLRVVGLVVAVLVALLFASWTALLVVAVVLAAYELAVTLVARGPASPAAGEDAPGGGADTDAAPVNSRQGGG